MMGEEIKELDLECYIIELSEKGVDTTSVERRLNEIIFSNALKLLPKVQ